MEPCPPAAADGTHAVQDQRIQNPLVLEPHVQDPYVQDHGQRPLRINWDALGTYHMSLANQKTALEYHTFLLALLVTLRNNS